MHAVLFQFGPLTIYWYGVMMAAGFLSALVSWIVLGRRCGRNAQYCSDLMFWVMISGVLGARLAYVLENWSDYAASPLSILRLDQGGLIFYGGLFAGGVAIFIFARRRRERVVPVVDFALTAVPLAHAIGRIGCFLNGCCFGTPTDLAVGVRFPKGSAAWMLHYRTGLIEQMSPFSLRVHPVQLYETAYNLIIFGVLMVVFRRSSRAGRVSAVYMVLYALGRFLLEFFRGDRADRFGAYGLSVGQLVSIPLFLVGVMVLIGISVMKPPVTNANGQS